MGYPPQRRRSSRDWRSQNRCIGDFEGDSYANWITELSNWMIGCDVSGHSVEHLEFNGMYSEVANRDGPTALMLYPDLLEGD